MTAASNSVNLLDEFRSSSSPLSPSLLQSLVHRLLSHPKIFNGFADVLRLPSVIESLGRMDASRRSAMVRTVELFAHGTVGRYFEIRRREGDDAVWKLNDVQLEKLRMLTVATVVRRHVEDDHDDRRGGRSDDSCSGTGEGGGGGGGGGGGVVGGNNDFEMKMAAFKIKKCDDITTKNNNKKITTKKKKKKKTTNDLCIPYSLLAHELRIPHRDDDDSGGGDAPTYNDADHMRQLEDVLIQCVYSNIVAARLDQSSRSLTISPHSSLSSDPSERDGGAFSGGGGGGVGGGGVSGSSKAVYGSVLSRDLDTSTPDRARAEASRMLSSLRDFLDRSNAVLANIDTTSRDVIERERGEDEARWAGVQRSIEKACGPARQREAGMSMSMSGGGGGGGDGRGVVMGMGVGGPSGAGPVGMGFGGAGTRLGGGGVMNMGRGGGGVRAMGEGGGGGGGDPMEVVDGGAGGGAGGVGRRQVKRSKGGHSMMMGRG